MRFFLIILFLSSISIYASEQSLVLTSGTNETVKIEGLSRVAVASSTCVKVKALPPDQLLLTAMKACRTTVRAWGKGNEEYLFHIEVRSPETGQVIHVSIEFLEVSSKDLGQLGIQWPEAISFSASGVAQAGANFSGLNMTGAFTTARGLISLLIKEGWAKLLAHPELYVRLGEQASFHSGGEIPIATTSEDYGRFHRKVEWKPFGLTLKIKPQSIDGLSIRSDVQVEISETNPSLMVDNLPSLVKRSVDTKMESQDGETVLLSGIVREWSSTEKTKAPGLSSIPIVGPLLFTETNKQKQSNEVLIAMTLSYTTAKARQEKREDIERLKKKIIPDDT